MRKSRCLVGIAIPMLLAFIFSAACNQVQRNVSKVQSKDQAKPKVELLTPAEQPVAARIDMRPYRDQIDMRKIVGYLRKKYDRVPEFSTLKDVPPSYLEIMGRTPEAMENSGLTDEKKWYRSDSRFFQFSGTR